MKAILSTPRHAALRVVQRMTGAFALTLLITAAAIVITEAAAMYVAVRTLASLIAQTLG